MEGIIFKDYQTCMVGSVSVLCLALMHDINNSPSYHQIHILCFLSALLMDFFFFNYAYSSYPYEQIGFEFKCMNF